MSLRIVKMLGAAACTAAMTAMFLTPVYAAGDEVVVQEGYIEEEAGDWSSIAAANVNTSANIRQEATTESPVVGGLGRGETANVIGEDNGWTEVSVAGIDGYIRSDLLVFGEEAKVLQEDVQTENSQAEEAVAQVAAADGELDLLAAIIQCEAGGESYEGKIAVGAVIMNRVRSGQFPDSISDVVYQSGQFSPASSGILASTLSQGARQDCYDAARDVLAGANNIGDRLYFNSGYGQGMQIGNQHFY